MKTEEDMCIICYSIKFEEVLFLTLCKHIYCRKCLIKLFNFKQKCAYCREKIDFMNIINIEFEQKFYENPNTIFNSIFSCTGFEGFGSYHFK